MSCVTEAALIPDMYFFVVVTAERRAEWLGRIQFLFDLKDSKQQSIQQRVMKELMLDMTQGTTSRV